MKKAALIDLISLLLVFWTSWHLKVVFPVDLQGPLVVISTSLVGLLILKKRGLTYRDIGFISRTLNGKFVNEVLQVSFLIFAIQFFGILIIGYLLGSPNPGSAVSNQPTTLIGFLMDIFFMTWIVTGLGEEFIFRGIVLKRLGIIFNDTDYSIYLISGIQAIWFGVGHQSQGLSGILITGLIGFALGVYLLKNPRLGLWPLIIAHGLIDTVVLTINFITK